MKHFLKKDKRQHSEKIAGKSGKKSEKSNRAKRESGGEKTINTGVAGRIKVYRYVHKSVMAGVSGCVRAGQQIEFPVEFLVEFLVEFTIEFFKVIYKLRPFPLCCCCFR